MTSALFDNHRAKLGHGLLSGEYSKPAPDPGEENGASEPRVRGTTATFYAQKCQDLVCQVLALTFDWSDCPCLFAGRPNRHRTKNVQSTCRARSPGVLHQSTAGCSGVFIALHKHGGGKVTVSFCLSRFSSACLSCCFFFHPQRNCRSGSNPSEAFRFLVEERIVCQQSQKAKYTQRVDYIVQLPVPMDQATNTGEGLTGDNETHGSSSLHCSLWRAGQ